MHPNIQCPIHSIAVPALLDGQRYDIYGEVHKALRLFMTDTMTRLAVCDPRDESGVEDSLQQLSLLLDVCAEHGTDENRFVHPAIERARPGGSQHAASEYLAYEETIAELRKLSDAVSTWTGANKAVALARLYRALALFVAWNLEHMEYEEVEHNTALWAHYSDMELLATKDALVASKSRSAMAAVLPWFIKGLNPSELAGMLGGMRAGMPQAAFDGVMALARDVLPKQRYEAIVAALGVA